MPPILSLLCAGTSAGLFFFAQSLPVMRTFHDQPYAGAIFQGFGSLTALGWHVALANLGLFAFWLASSLIEARLLRRDFRETARQDAASYLPLCLLLFALLRFNAFMAHYFEGLLLLAHSGAFLLPLAALIGVAYLKISRGEANRRRRPPKADPAEAGASWRLLAGLFLSAFFIYAAVGLYINREIGRGGDEPHYLLIAHSLAHDRDLAISNNYKRQDYRAFFSQPLDAHVSIGKDGTRYSIHPIGLPLLLVPAYALKGYKAALLEMCLMAACLSALLFLIAESLTRSRWLSLLLWGTVSFTPPLLFYASQFYPETPSALGVAAAYHLIRSDDRRRRWRPVLLGVTLAYLPWLQQRMILPAALLWGYHLYAIWRDNANGTADMPALRFSAAAPTLMFAASGLLMAGYYYVLFGNPLPNAPYLSVGVKSVFSAEIFLKEGLLGLLFDQEAGLFVFAPYFMLAAAGWLFLWRKNRAEACALFAVAASIYIPCAGFTLQWRGAWSPVARYMVALLPVVFAPLCLAVERAARTRHRYLLAALLLLGFAWSYQFLRAPDTLLMWNRGINSTFQESANLLPVFRYFPSFTRGTVGNAPLTAIWLGLIALLTLDLWRTEPLRPRISPTGAICPLKTLFAAYAGLIAAFGLWTFLKITPAAPIYLTNAHNRALRNFMAEAGGNVALRQEFSGLAALPREAFRFAYLGREKVGKQGKTPPGFLVTGPYEPYKRGKYTAYFQMAAQPHSPTETLAQLDIAAHSGIKIFAERAVAGQDFPTPGQAELVPLPFELTEDVTDLETRVYYEGAADVTVKRVFIEPAFSLTE